jgi:hypothetical protein
MSNEMFKGVPDKVKGWAILLIAFGVFAAGIGNGYVAISKKIASDRVNAEAAKYDAERTAKLLKEIAEREQKEAQAAKAKQWPELEWEKLKLKANMVTRYKDGKCVARIDLTNAERLPADEPATSFKLKDSDGFSLYTKDDFRDPLWDNDQTCHFEIELIVTLDEYLTASSWEIRPRL